MGGGKGGTRIHSSTGTANPGSTYKVEIAGSGRDFFDHSIQINQFPGVASLWAPEFPTSLGESRSRSNPCTKLWPQWPPIKLQGAPRSISSVVYPGVQD